MSRVEERPKPCEGCRLALLPCRTLRVFFLGVWGLEFGVLGLELRSRFGVRVQQER